MAQRQSDRGRSHQGPDQSRREKIGAEELENLIVAHPGVIQAAVVAMPDRVLGERVCAFLVTRDVLIVALDQLNQFLTDRGLARFKLPERVEILAELPLTKVGKIDKNALRDLARAAGARES